MCGKCEHLMGKAALGLGVVFMLLAVAAKLAGWVPMGVGPKSFAGASALLYLLSIAANSCKAGHEHA